MLFNNLMADDTTDYPRIMGDAGMCLGLSVCEDETQSPEGGWTSPRYSKRRDVSPNGLRSL